MFLNIVICLFVCWLFVYVCICLCYLTYSRKAGVGQWLVKLPMFWFSFEVVCGTFDWNWDLPMVILVFVVFVSDKSTRSHDSVVVLQGYHHRKCVVVLYVFYVLVGQHILRYQTRSHFVVSRGAFVFFVLVECIPLHRKHLSSRCPLSYLKN